MTQSNLTYLRRITRNLALAGLPFEIAALLAATQMRAAGIPITAENLDKAFA